MLLKRQKGPAETLGDLFHELKHEETVRSIMEGFMSVCSVSRHTVVSSNGQERELYDSGVRTK